MKNNLDCCDNRPLSNFKSLQMKRGSKPKVSRWTKITTVVLEIAAFVGAIKAIVEFINLVLPFFTR